MTSHARIHASLPLIALLVSAPACLVVEDDIDTLQAAADNACEPWDCGLNTKFSTAFFSGDLALDGTVNQAGYAVVGVELPGRPMHTLDVVNDEFGARDAGGSLVASGSSMVGADIVLSRDADTYRIRIVDFSDTLAYWSHPSDATIAYHLAYNLGDDTFIDLCKDPPYSDPNWSGGHETYATLITGERYDGQNALVSPSDPSDANWFNIACAGTAISKMKLLGYDPNTPSSSPYATTQDQRQATVKMIIADYCGTGRSFTEVGTPMLWENTAGWLTVDPADVTSREAIWGPEGAYCLDIPRLAYDSAGEPTLLEDMLTAIAAECELPPTCDEPPSMPEREWTTYNPL